MTNHDEVKPSAIMTRNRGIGYPLHRRQRVNSLGNLTTQLEKSRTKSTNHSLDHSISWVVRSQRVRCSGLTLHTQYLAQTGQNGVFQKRGGMPTLAAPQSLTLGQRRGSRRLIRTNLDKLQTQMVAAAIHDYQNATKTSRLRQTLGAGGRLSIILKKQPKWTASFGAVPLTVSLRRAAMFQQGGNLLHRRRVRRFEQTPKL